MVLGIRNKNRRGPSIQAEYIVHIQDIKPWPPTQSLKSVRSILIQWENGERNSGFTNSVTPSIDDGKVEFNESFKLPVTFSRDMSVKSGEVDVFHKNLLEFNLYEPRRDKTIKGQLLGTAIVDLADYGVIKEITSISAPVNCTRSFRNTAQPILYLRIQAYDKGRSGVSLRGRLVKETSLDKNDGDSVSALMSEEYADEAEIASFTDDDISSHSSLMASSVLDSNGASPSINKENGSGKIKCHSDGSELESDLNMGKSYTKPGQALESSKQISEEMGNLEDQVLTISISDSDAAISTAKGFLVKAPDKQSSEHEFQLLATRGREKYKEIPERNMGMEDAPTVYFDDMEEKNGVKQVKRDQTREMVKDETLFVRNQSSGNLSLDAVGNQFLSESDSPVIKDRVRHVRSIRSSTESSRTNDSTGGLSGNTTKLVINTIERKKLSLDSKTQGLEQRILILERELREAAALEVALYSVVAEHGSSINKVHAPARRLSRIYLRAGKGMKRASAAQSSISGLIVVAKACGNDVPRLTFWLSNCVVLRAILKEAFAEEKLPVSACSFTDRNKVRKGMDKNLSALQWNISSANKSADKISVNGNIHELEDPRAYMSTLEKVESWIFSRIVESVWWQALTPHMQSSAAQMIDKVVNSSVQKYRRSSSSGDQEQVNFSLELWKKAFKEACERICPLRAGGHDCGCLPVLAKLIMEQCVVRLDVAMFNAILRDSADDIPTDPVSDPISNAKVLPVPAGKSSFGSGAQLKNAIGNWSRWLTDLFGMDDDDPPEDEWEDGEVADSEGLKYDPSFKSFHLLKSLSDLMMLPKDLLLSESIRREVCPTFGAQVIKRVLEVFVPDEFCSDRIPNAVFESLDPENIRAEDEGSITNCPCTAPPVIYSPPPSSLASVMGMNLGTQSPDQLRSSGSVLRRSNTSDDELDELDSPLNAVLREDLHFHGKQNRKMVQNYRNNVIRYQLLREVWDDE